jgi:hypothetical protein
MLRPTSLFRRLWNEAVVITRIELVGAVAGCPGIQSLQAGVATLFTTYAYSVLDT